MGTFAVVSIQRLAWCWAHSLAASSMLFLKYSGALAATLGGTGMHSTVACRRLSCSRLAVSIKMTSFPCRGGMEFNIKVADNCPAATWRYP